MKHKKHNCCRINKSFCKVSQRPKKIDLAWCLVLQDNFVAGISLYSSPIREVLLHSHTRWRIRKNGLMREGLLVACDVPKPTWESREWGFLGVLWTFIRSVCEIGSSCCRFEWVFDTNPTLVAFCTVNGVHLSGIRKYLMVQLCEEMGSLGRSDDPRLHDLGLSFPSHSKLRPR